MENLSASIENTRLKYRKIFKSCFEECLRKIDKMNSDEDVYQFIETYLKEAYVKRVKLLESKNKYKCACCAMCCKLACSEFSQQELLDKANNGDRFAKQFISVFVPYETKDAAKSVFPEYIDLLEKTHESDVYFYHCPKVTEDNKCGDYENRPQICRDFPDNPLALLPKFCAYVKWKEEVQEDALKLQALIEILNALRKK